MRAWLIATWDSVRSGFWFYPGGLLLAAIVLGIGMPQIDRWLPDQEGFWTQWPAATGGAARALLAALAGTQITVAGVVFSSVMVTLSLTTSQFGSRLLRTFLSHSVSQWTLGMFLATGLYCLLVLPTVTVATDKLFIPHLSVWIALIAAVASVFSFVVFIHHASTYLQAQHIVGEVAEDLNGAIEVLFPETLGGPAAPQERTREEGQKTHDVAADEVNAWENYSQRVLHANSSGYLQGIDEKSLLNLATEHDLVVRLHFRPGHFVTRRMPLATVYANIPDATWETVAAELQRLFVLGRSRTPRQDVECAIEELVELALRALSPGINDPMTAYACIDFLCASLSLLMHRKIPSAVRADEEGNLRVITNAYTFERIVESAFAPLRQHAAGSTMVLVRMLDGLHVLACLHQSAEQAEVIEQQAKWVMQVADRTISESVSLSDARDRFDAILRQLANR